MIVTGEPLTYTKDGNVPTADLSFTARWEVRDDELWFHEEYRTADGELVRNDAHGAKLHLLGLRKE